MKLYLNKTRKYVLGMDATPESLLLSLLLKKEGYNFTCVHVRLDENNETEKFLTNFAGQNDLNLQVISPQEFLSDTREKNSDLSNDEDEDEVNTIENMNSETSSLGVQSEKNEAKNFVPRHVEFQAKNLRNKVLSVFTVRNGYDAVILSHTLQDQAESFFVKLSRGSGLRGLRGMQYLTKNYLGRKPIYFYRPLIRVSREEIMRNLSELLAVIELKEGMHYLGKKIPENSDHYYVRNIILPLFEQRWAFFYNNLRTLFESLQDDSTTILETLKPQRLVKADSLLKYSDSVLQSYIMNAFYELSDNMPSYGMVANFIRNIRNGEFGIQIHSGGLTIRYNRDGTLEIIPGSNNRKANLLLNNRKTRNQRREDTNNNGNTHSNKNRNKKEASEGNANGGVIFRTQQTNKKNLTQITI